MKINFILSPTFSYFYHLNCFFYLKCLNTKWRIKYERLWYIPVLFFKTPFSSPNLYFLISYQTLTFTYYLPSNISRGGTLAFRCVLLCQLIRYLSLIHVYTYYILYCLTCTVNLCNPNSTSVNLLNKIKRCPKYMLHIVCLNHLSFRV